jgi:vacuolar-type H+-ATPase subunit H
MKFPMAPLPSFVGAFVYAKDTAAKYAPAVAGAVGKAICDAAFVVAYCAMRVVEAAPGAIAKAKEVARPLVAAARVRASKTIEAIPGAVAKARESARTYYSAAHERATEFYAEAREFADKCGFYFFQTNKFGKVA